MRIAISLIIWVASFFGFSDFHADNGKPGSNVCKVVLSTYYYGFSLYAEGDNSGWDTWTMRHDWLPFPSSSVTVVDTCHRP